MLQIEAMAQVGGICMMDPDSPSKNFFFGGIDSCKFRKPVVPGDTLVQPGPSNALPLFSNADPSLPGHGAASAPVPSICLC